MKIPAPHRTAKHDPGGARVVPRDLVLLGFLADCAHAPTGVLAALTGMSIDMTRRRIRVLRDLGLVAKTVVAVNAADRVALTPAGRRLVAEKFGRDVDDVPAVRIGDGPFVHHDMGLTVAVALREAGAKSHHVALRRLLFERGVRAALGAPGGALVPDGFAEFVNAGGTAHALALEMDAGTCDPKWVAANKLVVYAEHAAAGGSLLGVASWSVCVVVPTLRRVHQLTAALWSAGVPEHLVYLLPLDAVRAEDILGDVWLTPTAVPGSEDVVLATACPLAPILTNRHGGRNGHDGTLPSFSLAFSTSAPERSGARSAR